MRELVMTWTGTINPANQFYGSTDTLGLFGTPGSNLGGDEFSAQIAFDTDMGSYLPHEACGSQCGGDLNYLGTSPGNSFLSASLTVNDHTINIPPDAALIGGHVEFSFVSLHGQGLFHSQLTLQLIDQPNPVSVLETYSASGGYPDDIFTNSSLEWGSNPAYLSFNPHTLIVYAVPEPATWMLALAGFLALGLSQWRRANSQ